MNRTTVDWWSFRAQTTPEGVLAACRGAFGQAGDIANLEGRGAGWQGYDSSASLRLGDFVVGIVAWGGHAQRGWVHTSITGRGCAWLDVDRALEAWDTLPAYEDRRVDIALTTTDGSVGHDQVLAAYHGDGFRLGRGGRPPDLRVIVGGKPEDGRTIYVGSRGRDKFFRGYEKGWEMLKGVDLEGASNITVGGVPVEDVYRLELELKAKTGPLPVDLVERRDQYFAGAYPYLQRVMQIEPEVMVMRRERGPQNDLARALANIRRQYGSTLFTACTAYHGDFGAVWSQVVGREHNQALLEAGVLLVDHE